MKFHKMLILTAAFALAFLPQISEQRHKKHRRSSYHRKALEDVLFRNRDAIIKQYLRTKRPISRIYLGTDVQKDQYPFVVVLALNISLPEYKIPALRTCTGSLITTQWVLTAAHCMEDVMLIPFTVAFYGNLAKIPNAPHAQVLKVKNHPGYRVVKRELAPKMGLPPGNYDISLWLVTEVDLDPSKLGKLHAIDYAALLGKRVVYVGGGSTYSNFQNESEKHRLSLMVKDTFRPLQVGEAVIVKCDEEMEEYADPDAHICLRAKCSNVLQQARPGDSGGPVLLRGKILGVAKAVIFNANYMQYTSVNPYLEWITRTVNKKIKIKKLKNRLKLKTTSKKPENIQQSKPKQKKSANRQKIKAQEKNLEKPKEDNATNTPKLRTEQDKSVFLQPLRENKLYNNIQQLISKQGQLKNTLQREIKQKQHQILRAREEKAGNNQQINRLKKSKIRQQLRGRYKNPRHHHHKWNKQIFQGRRRQR